MGKLLEEAASAPPDPEPTPLCAPPHHPTELIFTSSSSSPTLFSSFNALTLLSPANVPIYTVKSRAQRATLTSQPDLTLYLPNNSVLATATLKSGLLSGKNLAELKFYYYPATARRLNITKPKSSSSSGGGGGGSGGSGSVGGVFAHDGKSYSWDVTVSRKLPSNASPPQTPQTPPQGGEEGGAGRFKIDSKFKAPRVKFNCYSGVLTTADGGQKLAEYEDIPPESSEVTRQLIWKDGRMGRLGFSEMGVRVAINAGEGRDVAVAALVAMLERAKRNAAGGKGDGGGAIFNPGNAYAESSWAAGV